MRWKQEQELKQSEWTKAQQELETYRTREQKIKSKDYSALKELGFDYNDYTKYLLNNEQPTPETIIEKRLAEVESRIEQKIREQKEAEQKQKEQLLTDHQEQIRTKFKSDIKGYLENDFGSSEPKFEFLSIQEQPEDIIYSIIEEHYNKTAEKGEPRILSKEEAAELAEKYLEEEAEKKLFALRKVKSRLMTKPDPSPAGQKAGFVPSQTLTNDVRAPQSTNKSSFTLEDSLSEATKLLKWQ